MRAIANGCLRAATLTGLLLTPAVWPAPASGDGLQGPGCAPEVARAMEAAAIRGTRRDAAIIRDQATGIRDPQSLFAFSCIDRLLSGQHLDVHVSMNSILDGLLGLVEREVCDLANQVYATGVTRPVDAAMRHAGVPQLPGLRIQAPVTRNPDVRIEVEPLRRPRPHQGAGQRLEGLLTR